MKRKRRISISEKSLKRITNEEIILHLISEGFFDSVSDGIKGITTVISKKIKNASSNLSDSAKEKFNEYSNKMKELLEKIISKLKQIKDGSEMKDIKGKHDDLASELKGEKVLLSTDDSVKTVAMRLGELSQEIVKFRDSIGDQFEKGCRSKKAKEEEASDEERDVARSEYNKGLKGESKFIDLLDRQMVIVEIDIKNLNSMNYTRNGNVITEVAILGTLFTVWKITMAVIGGLQTTFKVMSWILRWFDCTGWADWADGYRVKFEKLEEIIYDCTLTHPKILYYSYKILSKKTEGENIKTYDEFRKDKELVDKYRQGAKFIVLLPLTINALWECASTCTSIFTSISKGVGNEGIIQTGMQALKIVGGGTSAKKQYDVTTRRAGDLHKRTKDEELSDIRKGFK